MGRTNTFRSCWKRSQLIALLWLRRLSQNRQASSACRRLFAVSPGAYAAINMPPLALFVGKLAMSLLFSAAVIAVLFALAAFGFHQRLRKSRRKILRMTRAEFGKLCSL